MIPDLSDMALIPAGTFIMGSLDGYIDERPLHEAQISPFYLDARVVTNREYQTFIKANPEWSKKNITLDKADKNYLNLWAGDECPEELLDFSVINVSQHAARAFAKWVGKRLPTEAEWEYAAGGPERFRWSLGNTFSPADYVFGLDGGQPRGAKPATHRPNSYGLYDMSGLVWEWTEDYYSPDFYEKAEKINPRNRNRNEEWGVLRGGAAYFDDPFFLRVHIRGRNFPVACNEDYGFRCARDLNDGSL